MLASCSVLFRSTAQWTWSVRHIPVGNSNLCWPVRMPVDGCCRSLNSIYCVRVAENRQPFRARGLTGMVNLVSIEILLPDMKGGGSVGLSWISLFRRSDSIQQPAARALQQK